MLKNRVNQSQFGFIKRLLGAIYCAIGLFCVSEKGYGQEGTGDNEPPTAGQIDQWIHQLESDSYASRHLAIQLLQKHPTSALASVEQAIESSEEDAANRMIRLLGRWSVNPDRGYGEKAYEVLNRVAQGGVSSRSSLALNVIDAIRKNQSIRSTEYLGRLSAFIGLETDRLFAMNLQYNMLYVLRINESFLGTVEDLKCAKWLSDVQVVRLIGPRVDRAWLEQIAKIPNLRTLQIRHTSITSEDLRVLQSLNRLEGLEILYTPIDDGAIEVLGSLPLWGRLRVFGTKMSADGAEKLKEQLEGMDVTFGLGGFLGIASNQDTLVISQVLAGGGAEKAGLKVQDRIISIEGKKLQRFMELRAELAKYPPGATVSIELERIERTENLEGITVVTQTIEVTLGEQTDAN